MSTKKEEAAVLAQALAAIPRPLAFALEVALSLLLAAAGAWVAARVSGKINGKANADIRSSLALNRIAAAMERAYPERHALPQPSLLHDAALKPIPSPDHDPEPCSADMFTCGDERQARIDSIWARISRQ